MSSNGGADIKSFKRTIVRRRETLSFEELYISSKLECCLKTQFSTRLGATWGILQIEDHFPVLKKDRKRQYYVKQTKEHYFPRTSTARSRIKLHRSPTH